MLKNFLNILAGNPQARELQYYKEVVDQVNALEPQIQAMSDSELRGLTEMLRERVRAYTDPVENREEFLKAEREILDQVLPEAFAAVREASRRAIGLRHYDVQIIGGVVLHEGKIAEMRTGEGKTLVATLPLYLNALTGRGAHLVTVNDYLARRDGGWMGPIYHLLGMSAGVIGKEQFSAIFDPDYVDPGGELEDERLVHWKPSLRAECYLADITYGTSAEFGFDYLRDHTATEISRTVQRGDLAYTIVDEVDSVLIDGARTPLIISGPAAQASRQYQRFAEIIEKARLRKNTTDLNAGEEPDGDYAVDERTESIALTDRGIEKIERLLPEIDVDAGQSLYDPEFYDLVHYLDNALKAKLTFKRDVDYIVQNGSVILIDQTTGRPMPSRRFSEGLHQAIEAKEGVQVRREDQTIATITIQNYFRLYDKLAGMTGTALTQAEEFDEVYKLDVVAIPTNVEFRAEIGELTAHKEKDAEENISIIMYHLPEQAATETPAFYKRIDFPDRVYTNLDGKLNAIIDEISEFSQAGRPILVGTGSVEASEIVSQRLGQLGLAHEILNAKNHDREALIVAQAGRPGAITISTNMAGRGTDILLGGNPEGLAAKHVNDHCFGTKALSDVVSSVVKGDLEHARQKARLAQGMDETIVDWIVQANEDMVKMAQVEDVIGAVIGDIRQEPQYAMLSFDSIAELVRHLDLMRIDPRRINRARQMVEDGDMPSSLLPDIQYRLAEYRSVSGLLGQNGHVEVLTRRLYEKHYNARAALVRAVLANQVEEAQIVARQIPALPASLIGDIQQIIEGCKQARQHVWELGGLHVLGTERHESRRIDDQLRGRAARQGDPGSSRFYLSLEDELMIRFGGERTKRIMDRFNIPGDIPISANMLTNMIEQSQARFESYLFDIRKNLVEYDEAVNVQRQVVYDERRAILEGVGEGLDQMVRQFIQDAIMRIADRTINHYEEWAMGEIEGVLEDYSDVETGEVNTRGLLRRVYSLFPRLATDEMEALLGVTREAHLLKVLREYILDGMEEGYHLRMLHAEISRIVPIWPVLPPFRQRGVEGWEAFMAQVRETFARFTDTLPAERVDEIWNTWSAEADSLFRNQVAGINTNSNLKEVQDQFYSGLNRALSAVFLDVIWDMEIDEIVSIMLDRFDYLLEIAKQETQNTASDLNSTNGAGWAPDRQVFSIGQEELDNYERALMLTVIDEEWRQYLRAIDGLRQGVGLAAVGQRDPKIEFKRRAFEMFEQLRLDVQEGIARRFFESLPRHRQIVEAQRQQDAILDRLAQTGYRIKQQVSRADDGSVRVTQTIERDMWSNVGRNDPCPCGSGKKFKDCHYQQIQQQQSTSREAVAHAPAGNRRGGGKRPRRRR